MTTTRTKGKYLVLWPDNDESMVVESRKEVEQALAENIRYGDKDVNMEIYDITDLKPIKVTTKIVVDWSDC